jgi:hypothetical protein
LSRWTRRIKKRTEQTEDGSRFFPCQPFAHLRDRLECRMKLPRENETEPELLDAFSQFFRRKMNFDA